MLFSCGSQPARALRPAPARGSARPCTNAPARMHAHPRAPLLYSSPPCCAPLRRERLRARRMHTKTCRSQWGEVKKGGGATPTRFDLRDQLLPQLKQLLSEYSRFYGGAELCGSVAL